MMIYRKEEELVLEQEDAGVDVGKSLGKKI
jgi:hypothetical protein